MNRTIWPSAAWISFSTAFSRSSNSPRYFEPASRAPMSSAITRRSRRLSGTSPATIRCARPSTIAVLPTPGSPIRTGLFLVRRESTWITRRISSSRPITGSSLPCSASAVRSRPNFSSACIVSSGFGRGDAVRPAHLGDRLRQRVAVGQQVGERPRTCRRGRAGGARWRCTRRRAPAISFSARCSARTKACDGRTSGSASPPSLGSPRPRPALAGGSRRRRRRASAAPAPRGPSSWSSRASSRCAGATSGLRRSAASRCAAATASWDLIVNRSGCIA